MPDVLYAKYPTFYACTQAVGKNILSAEEDDKLKAVVKQSVPKLSTTEDIFLDIAGVCANLPVQFLVAAWDSILIDESAKEILENLRSVSLISYGEQDGTKVVAIHDVLRDVGRNMIKTRAERLGAWSHFWSPVSNTFLKNKKLVSTYHTKLFMPI